MRYLFVSVLLLFPSLIHAGEPVAIRPVDAVAADALAQALRQSDTVRALVATLETTNVIVHIESSFGLPAGIGGMTRFAVSRGGFRYLRISIPADMPLRGRTAILAHELQHAVEIARSDADDAESLRRLFEREGRRSGNYFETQAALDVERRVRRERGAATLQTEPVVKFHH